MARRTRDRRGRFLKGRARVKSRRSSRRGRARSSNPPRRRRRRSSSRRRAARTSNPPRRRRRSRGRARTRNAPATRYRTRHIYHRSRGRRRNPGWTLTDALKAFALIGSSFALVWWLLPMAIMKLAKKPEWSQGWKPVGVAAASGLLVVGLSYGIGRLIWGKRQANMMALQAGIGASLAVIVEGAAAWKRTKGSAPAPSAAASAATSGAAPAGVRGGGYFSPQQMNAASAAANVVRRQGQGYFSPQQYARATSGGVLLGGAWPTERNF